MYKVTIIFEDPDRDNAVYDDVEFIENMQPFIRLIRTKGNTWFKADGVRKINVDLMEGRDE
jgi:hypothetical protein